MKISMNWIKEILESDLDPHTTAEKLTMSGCEVEEVEHFAAPGTGVVSADVLETTDHPSSGGNGLKVVKVWTGREEAQVVCGAPNTPGRGAKVVFAGEGVEIKGIRLERREFDGVMSAGMLCSEEELDIGPDDTGIIVLDGDLEAGTPLSRAIELEDWILDISLTPNRPDMLGHIGAAREIALLQGLRFDPPASSGQREGTGEEASGIVRIVVEDPEGCPRYTAAVVKDVEIGPSPLKIRNRLHRLGVRPISNAVDVTNWILLLHNQPLHAFDLKRVGGAEITVRRARKGERIITLDGVDRYLDEEDLVIADKFSPVAVAGIMGGEGSGIEEYTKDILIECAYFDPRTIRKTSAKLNLSSESSYRFERGIDPSNQPGALADCVSMMCRLTGGTSAIGLLDIHPKPCEPAGDVLRESRVKKIIGTGFDWEENLDILARLGCKVRKEGSKASVTAPPFRPDLTREIDFIEEIARIQGFDRIPSTNPVISLSSPARGSYDTVRSVRQHLAAGGFTEAVNLSLVGREKQKTYFPDLEPIGVANPLSNEKDTMRLSLVPGLLDNLAYAVSWKEKTVRIFEVGTVFHRGQSGPVQGIVEKTNAAAAAFGPRPGWVGEKRGEADFYDVLGLLRHLCEVQWHREPGIEKMQSGAPAFLLPASACRVFIEGEPCGWIGELHPELYLRLELPGTQPGRGKIGILEITLPERRTEERTFKPIPAYPTVERDIAMVFDEKMPVGDVLHTIREEGGGILESAELFDVYRGRGVDAGKKSLAFSLVFRSGETTLRTDEVEAVHRKIVTALEARHGGKLRE